MIHRSFLSLIFAVLLMFGQQQAMEHAYVHTADLQQKSTNEDKPTNHSEVCGKCVALANLGAAVGSQAHILNITSGQFQLSTSLHQSIISQRVLAYHSRAPPHLA
jgi:hypothetical protein